MTAHEEHFAFLPLHEVAERAYHTYLTLRTGLTVREGKIKIPPRLLDDFQPVLYGHFGVNFRSRRSSMRSITRPVAWAKGVTVATARA